MSTTKVTPSYYGYVGSTNDALLIIQAVIEKQLEPIPRRPHERERTNLIKSGNVFVFIEEESGIKRWTDGIAWSPSRILGRFLVYRELDKHLLSEKDDKKKKKRKTSVGEDPLDLKQLMPPAQQLLQNQTQFTPDDFSKQLVGLMQSLFVFKDQGLIKKTLSLSLKNELDSLIESSGAKSKSKNSNSVNNSSSGGSKSKNSEKEGDSNRRTIHLISYYNADDVLNGKLQRPSVTDLKDIQISLTLWTAMKESSLGGKIPIEDEAYYFLDTNYQLQIMLQVQQPPVDRLGLQNGVTGLLQNLLGNMGLLQSQQQQHHLGGGPPQQQHLLYMQQLKFNPMHVLPNPYGVKEEDQQLQHQLQQSAAQQSGQPMLPPPPPGELTFVNPFNSQNSSNNYSSFYNNYSFPPPQGQQQQQTQGLTQAQQQQQIQGALQPLQNLQQGLLYLDGTSGGYQHYPPFPQHFQQLYGTAGANSQHNRILNLSEYSMNLSGSVLLVGSTVVDVSNLSSNGNGSILLASGGVPSTLGKKLSRSSFSHGNWFTTASVGSNGIGLGQGGYVAQAPPPHTTLQQTLSGLPESGLHHHHEENTNQMQRNTYSGTT